MASRLSLSLHWLEELPRMPRPLRYVMLAGMHLGLFALAYVSAFAMRFDLQVPWQYQQVMWEGMGVLLAAKMATFALLGMFQGWWKYVSLYDLLTLARGVILASLVFVVVNAGLVDPPSFPRSVYLLDALCALIILGAARGSLRLAREIVQQHAKSVGQAMPIVIVGAGDTGETLLREIAKNPNLRYQPVAFVDDDPFKRGLRIRGLPVHGPIEELPRIVADYGAEQVVIAMPSAPHQRLRKVIELAQQARVQTRILPAVESILAGNVSLRQLREVSIQDLLGREPVRLDTEAIGGFVKGRTVLVTGAGGSIGAEICRQVLRFEPAQLVMVDSAETPLFFIHQELAEHHGSSIRPHVANVTDQGRMQAIFEEHRPEVVLHAAAYKHVPMMEQNACEAVKNNIGGTQVVADLAALYGAERFVLISTDKAVNPTSIMGTTKRVTELYVQSLNARFAHTRFCAVRFGNVLGSNGSVVPIFREQIRRGGPVTVTHPEMTRYFMTIPEAVQLVLQAASFDMPGEMFILDMGEPVRIADLARDMIRLSGFSTDEIAIVYTGMRPGEKLFEELTLAEEDVDRTSHAKIFVGKGGRQDFEPLRPRYESLLTAAHAGQAHEVRQVLKSLVPTYAYTPAMERAPAPAEEADSVQPLAARSA